MCVCVCVCAHEFAKNICEIYRMAWNIYLKEVPSVDHFATEVSPGSHFDLYTR